MNTIGERIKSVRKSNALTQSDFSNQLRISRPYVSCIENGKDTPSSSLILLISIIFNISEEWIRTGIKE